MSVITDLADSTLRMAETAQRGVGSLFESRLRIGVTGLNRAGKTVFITSLLANLLHPVRGEPEMAKKHAADQRGQDFPAISAHRLFRGA